MQSHEISWFPLIVAHPCDLCYACWFSSLHQHQPRRSCRIEASLLCMRLLSAAGAMARYPQRCLVGKRPGLTLLLSILLTMLMSRTITNHVLIAISAFMAGKPTSSFGQYMVNSPPKTPHKSKLVAVSHQCWWLENGLWTYEIHEFHCHKYSGYPSKSRLSVLQLQSAEQLLVLLVIWGANNTIYKSWDMQNWVVPYRLCRICCFAVAIISPRLNHYIPWWLTIINHNESLLTMLLTFRGWCFSGCEGYRCAEWSTVVKVPCERDLHRKSIRTVIMLLDTQISSSIKGREQSHDWFLVWKLVCLSLVGMCTLTDDRFKTRRL